jgi:hypothetical protein
MCSGGCLFIAALVFGIPVLCILALVALAALGSAVNSDAINNRRPSGSNTQTEAIYNATTDAQALAAAQTFVVGTWSYTTPNQFWQKWVIQQDGTVLAYTANQNDKDWGEPHVYDWKVAKSTYSDTGEVCYAFHAMGRTLSDGVLDATIGKDGSLSAISRYDSSVYATLHRGDDAHFSGN